MVKRAETLNRTDVSEPQGSSLLVVDRVEHELRKLVSQPGTKLPREWDLVARYGVSRQSVRQAIARLKKEKILRSVPGKGTFVLPPTQRQTTVHLITLTMQSVYTLAFVGALSEVFRRHGYSVHLIVSADPFPEWREIGKRPETSLGGVLIGPFTRQEILAMKEAGSLPLVHVSEMDEPHRTLPVCDTVLNDNVLLAHQATDYLIRQGHRRIALLGWGNPRVWDYDFLRGYSDALRSHGIEPDLNWNIRLPSSIPEATPPSLEVARSKIRSWQDSPDRPTALLHPAEDEVQINGILHEEFHDGFPPDCVVVMAFWEMLQFTYRGQSSMVGFTTRLSDLAEGAVEFLLRRRKENGPVRRELHSRVFMVQRKHGLWQKENGL